MISKRTLEKWRGESLRHIEVLSENSTMIKLNERILKLTQELLDQHLLRKEK